jgi:hypothetical protein
MLKKIQIYLNQTTKPGNLHQDICHIFISDMYKAKINIKYCSASVAGLSINSALLTATYVGEKYKQKALSPVHVDSGDVNVPFCLLSVTIVSSVL